MADFQEHLAAFDALDTQLIAASSDSLEAARGTVQELGLEFTVLYGLDAAATAQKIGCYTGERKGTAHVQPADFILNPDGTIALAVYSSGKVGRLGAADALTVVKD
ncbi:hypothetical protein BH23GEM9_BH23GEM9_14690 [soil metagenome]